MGEDSPFGGGRGQGGGIEDIFSQMGGGMPQGFSSGGRPQEFGAGGMPGGFGGMPQGFGGMHQQQQRQPQHQYIYLNIGRKFIITQIVNILLN